MKYVVCLMLGLGACGVQGPQGLKGDSGSIGNPGEPGKPAVPCVVQGSKIVCPDGSSINVDSLKLIQFCSSQGNTTYGHFPEYGICIANRLVAVYWNNKDAFLAEIVPGNYTSTSTGLKCTFQISANCGVKEL